MTDHDALLHKCAYGKEAMVDILMLTYNHEEFIENAIESVLMQQTSYPYRLMIGEDCSIDHTRKIVMDYYRRYPDKIELFIWKKNVGVSKNIFELLQNSHAKYVAYLEGDDYWTDPMKLQKQISFLEEQKGFIGTAHNVRCVDAKGSFLHRDFHLYPVREEHVYGKERAEKFELASQTASLLHRNIWREYKKEDLEQIFLHCPGNGDSKINLLLGLRGDIYCFKDIMAAHRRVFSGDSWTAKSYEKNMLLFRYTFICEMQTYIKEVLGIDFDIHVMLRNIYEECLIKIFCQCNTENLNVFRKIWMKEVMRKNEIAVSGRSRI